MVWVGVKFTFLENMFMSMRFVASLIVFKTLNCSSFNENSSGYECLLRFNIAQWNLNLLTILLLKSVAGKMATLFNS